MLSNPASRYERPGLALKHPTVDAFQARCPGFLKEQQGLTGDQIFAGLKTFFIANAIDEAHSTKDDNGAATKLDDRLEFSRYLSVCLDQVLEDTIAFSEYTWIMVLVVFVTQGGWVEGRRP